MLLSSGCGPTTGRRMGPGRPLPRRHHGSGAPPASGSPRARSGCPELRGPRRRDPRARVQVSTALTCIARWPVWTRPSGTCAGSVEGKSVYELVRGQPCRAFRPMPRACVETSRPRTRSNDSSALRDSHGFDAFKVRIGKECGHDEDEWPGRTEALVAQVRAALGDDAALLVDANSCYSPARAIEVGHMLERARCRPTSRSRARTGSSTGPGEVTAALELDVTGGEQDWDERVWRRMTQTRVVDVVQPDVCYVGGFTRALRVAQLARTAGLRCHAPLGEPLPRHSSSRCTCSRGSRIRASTWSSRSSRTTTTRGRSTCTTRDPRSSTGECTFPKARDGESRCRQNGSPAPTTTSPSSRRRVSRR